VSFACSYEKRSASARPRPAAKAVDVLVDLVVHQQDVRRPLELGRSIEPQTLAAALHRASRRAGLLSGLLPGKKRTSGLKLRATDIDWEHGEGEELQGPGEALLMAIGGRRAALVNLSGPGLDTLTTRLQDEQALPPSDAS
jgi:hypothetical protein